MSTVAVVYFSGQGHTHLMAEAFAEGVRNAGADTFVHRLQGSDIHEGRWKDPGGVHDAVKAADALVLGTPTYMGGVSAQLKAFIDSMGGLWFAQALAGKLAGGFTHSSSPIGEKTATLMYLQVHAAQHGMDWVSNAVLPDRYTGGDRGLNELGSFLGPAGQADPDQSENPDIVIKDSERQTCHAYAERLVGRLKG